MNILMVFHAPPYPPDIGPSRRHYHELVELLSRGHRVSVLSYGTEAQREQFLRHFGGRCARVEYVPLHASAAGKALSRCWHLALGRSDFARLRTRRLQGALDAMVTRDTFDVVSFSTTMLGGLRLPAGPALLGDTHNIEFDYLRRAFEQTRNPALRQYFRLQSVLTRREEVSFVRRFGVVCVTSDRDRDVLLRAAPGARIAVVPNGVDLEYHRRTPAAIRESGTILFTGLMSYYPNVHGARFFLDEVFPHVLRRVPHARLLIVGADPPLALRRRASERVIVTGYVPDVRPYLERAEAYVVPLHIGGGTRVKALQAMAMGVPVISTSLGCEGLGLLDGEHALIADTPAEFAEALIRVLQDGVLRERLAARARESVRGYAWPRIGDRLEHAFATAGRPAVHPAAPGVAYAADSH